MSERRCDTKNRWRNVVVAFRMSPQEAEDLNVKVALSGLSKQDYLIDYEYAGDNDPFFDVMSFVTENDLTQDEIDRFIQAYFQRLPTEDEKKDLFNYQQFHNLLWCTWACMMFEARHDEVYLDIAKQKFKAIQ